MPGPLLFKARVDKRLCFSVCKIEELRAQILGGLGDAVKVYEELSRGESWLASGWNHLGLPWFHPGFHFGDLMWIVIQVQQKDSVIFSAAGGWSCLRTSSGLCLAEPVFSLLRFLSSAGQTCISCFFIRGILLGYSFKARVARWFPSVQCT